MHNEDRRYASRYRELSRRYLEHAVAEAGGGRWQRVEELLWASLTAAVKAVAWSRGVALRESSEIDQYAGSLAREKGDRSIGGAFRRLSRTSSLAEWTDEDGLVAQQLTLLVYDVRGWVDRMWHLLPSEEA